MATENLYKYFGNYFLALRGMMGRITAGVPGVSLSLARGTVAVRQGSARVRVLVTRGELK